MPLILRRIALSVLCVCALAAIGATATVAAASPFLGARAQFMAFKHLSTNTKQDKLCQEATTVRKKVVKQFGKRTPGRDICTQGLPSGQKPSRGREEHYLQTLQRMIAPPIASATASPSLSGTASVSSSSAGTGILPSCASESGTNYSTGPSNTNPSGATGRYQEMPEHFMPGGICAGLNVTVPADQDKCAVLIYRAQGASAWVGCGG
jgi:hypothetical protein